MLGEHVVLDLPGRALLQLELAELPPGRSLVFRVVADNAGEYEPGQLVRLIK